MSHHTSPHMKWHAQGSTKNGVLRHPTNGEAWKAFDSRYPVFASDPLNVRLGLASDRFNPFGNMSSSHSTWPLMFVPYNLPPWMCMKQLYFMLSLIIPSPSAPYFMSMVCCTAPWMSTKKKKVKTVECVSPLKMREIIENQSPTERVCSQGQSIGRITMRVHKC